MVPNQARIGTTIRKLRTIATPPPLGVGTECELLALGISIKLRAKAYLRRKPVTKSENPNTVANKNRLLKIQLPEQQRFPAV
jgi:hypothetical protein